MNKLLKNADTVIILAGAGMSAECGFETFRGTTGFWNNKSFAKLANYQNFLMNITEGWEFYGYRFNEYKNGTPHAGYEALLDFITLTGKDHFVITSNVDGMFEKAGFNSDKIFEVHGNIFHTQCIKCLKPLSKLESYDGVIPKCDCGCALRPNILMFDDDGFITERHNVQEKKYYDFVRDNKGKKTVIIEIGAGTAVPTIRLMTSELSVKFDAPVFRINPIKSKSTKGVAISLFTLLFLNLVCCCSL